jgi:hypothetical protein
MRHPKEKLDIQENISRASRSGCSARRMAKWFVCVCVGGGAMRYSPSKNAGCGGAKAEHAIGSLRAAHCRRWPPCAHIVHTCDLARPGCVSTFHTSTSGASVCVTTMCGCCGISRILFTCTACVRTQIVTQYTIHEIHSFDASIHPSIHPHKKDWGSTTYATCAPA